MGRLPLPPQAVVGLADALADGNLTGASITTLQGKDETGQLKEMFSGIRGQAVELEKTVVDLDDISTGLTE